MNSNNLSPADKVAIVHHFKKSCDALGNKIFIIIINDSKTIDKYLLNFFVNNTLTIDISYDSCRKFIADKKNCLISFYALFDNKEYHLKIPISDIIQLKDVTQKGKVYDLQDEKTLKNYLEKHKLTKQEYSTKEVLNKILSKKNSPFKVIK